MAKCTRIIITAKQETTVKTLRNEKSKTIIAESSNCNYSNNKPMIKQLGGITNKEIKNKDTTRLKEIHKYFIKSRYYKVVRIQNKAIDNYIMAGKNHQLHQ